MTTFLTILFLIIIYTIMGGAVRGISVVCAKKRDYNVDIDDAGTLTFTVVFWPLVLGYIVGILFSEWVGRKISNK